MRAALLAALGLVAAGCSAPVGDARDQWQVFLSTDARIPQFGDRMLIEVLGKDGALCDPCRREFSVLDRDALPLSFGVTPEDAGDAPSVHVRFFRTADTGPLGPASDRIVDAYAHLPPASGVTDVSMPIAMACFGSVADVDGDVACDPATGKRGEAKTLEPLGDGALLASDSWGPATLTDCRGAPAGMACIGGGAFLMGAPRFAPIDDGEGLDLDPKPEQLVRVSPFALDAEEFTVGQARALQASIGAPETGDGCTFTAGSSDDMPLTCATIAYAKAACAALGKRLPSEAEWEWAGGNRDEETSFPWTDDGPTCERAIIAIGEIDGTDAFGCRKDTTTPVAPVAGGSRLDKTRDGVFNMGGNVSEWVADTFVAYGDATCWGEEVSLRDDAPCTVPATPVTAVRGGNYLAFEALAAVTVRGALGDATVWNFMGFRCAADVP